MGRFDNDLAAKFKAEWPDFFRDVECGFYLPAEWEELVWDLCSQIEHQMTWRKVPLEALHVGQVKEKFGGLRFYYDTDFGDEYLQGAIRGAVSLAEALSFGIK